MDSVLDDIGLMLSAFHFDIFLNVSWSGQEEREIEKCEKEFRDTVESVSTVHTVHGPNRLFRRFLKFIRTGYGFFWLKYSRKFASNKNIPESLLATKPSIQKNMVHCIVRRHTYTRIKTQSKITYVTGPILLDITQCINTSSLRSNPIILELFSSNFFKLYSLSILSFLFFIACTEPSRAHRVSKNMCVSALLLFPTSQHSLQPRSPKITKFTSNDVPFFFLEV